MGTFFFPTEHKFSMVKNGICLFVPKPFIIALGTMSSTFYDPVKVSRMKSLRKQVAKPQTNLVAFWLEFK